MSDGSHRPTSSRPSRRGRAKPGAGEPPAAESPAVVVKGTPDGLRLVVTTSSPEAAESALREWLARQPTAFFRGAAVELALAGNDVDTALASRLAPILRDAGMVLRHIAVTEERGGERARGPREPAGAPSPTADSVVVCPGSLRAGQRVVHDGSVIVFGDVEAGAEIVAGASVIVWGRLRGKVEAGLSGTPEARVCALDLSPSQLRIGRVVARAPDEPGRVPVPEIAVQQGGHIVVSAWR